MILLVNGKNKHSNELPEVTKYIIFKMKHVLWIDNHANFMRFLLNFPCLYVQCKISFPMLFKSYKKNELLIGFKKTQIINTIQRYIKYEEKAEIQKKTFHVFSNSFDEK